MIATGLMGYRIGWVVAAFPGMLWAAGPLVVPQFEEVSARSGIEAVLENCATENKYMIETMTGGVAVFDYDNDGLLDIYLVNGAPHPKLEKTGPKYSNRLYRNLGGLRFLDVTDRAGVAGRGYSMAVATGDYDNDGWVDLFVAGVNYNTLYRNRGDGTFEDVTERAGVTGRRPDGFKPWSVAAAWFDYDNDGDLDLLVVNYLVWDYSKEIFCGEPGRYRAYCHPKHYAGLPNTLYRNNGDGTFTDVSQQAGLLQHVGKGMAVALADYDLDGDVDVFVTNDTVPNFLFRNLGNGRFEEVGLMAGVALNDDGRALSSMGADFRDYDNDGRPDLLVTALTNETFPLFRNLGRGLFLDVTYPSQLGSLTLNLGGWGCGLYDLNYDGFKDVFIANGDVQNNVELYSSRKSRQPNRVLLNRGDGVFVAPPLPALDQRLAQHRGAAFGDLDGDGWVDIVVTRLGEPPEIWRNRPVEGHHWLALRLEGRRSNRDGIGARIHLVAEDGREQWNHVTTSFGYASASDRVVYFGLGSARQVKKLEIFWPSGVRQELSGLECDRYLTVREP